MTHCIDDPKENEEFDADLEEFNLDEYSDVEDLDDFFEDEGEAGADAFDMQDDDDDVAAAPVASEKTKGTGGGSSSVMRILKTVVVLSLLGGGSYAAYNTPAVRTHIDNALEMAGIKKSSNGDNMLLSNGDPFSQSMSYDEVISEPPRDIPEAPPILGGSNDMAGNNDFGVMDGDDVAMNMGDEFADLPMPTAAVDGEFKKDEQSVSDLGGLDTPVMPDLNAEGPTAIPPAPDMGVAEALPEAPVADGEGFDFSALPAPDAPDVGGNNFVIEDAGTITPETNMPESNMGVADATDKLDKDGGDENFFDFSSMDEVSEDQMAKDLKAEVKKDVKKADPVLKEITQEKDIEMPKAALPVSVSKDDTMPEEEDSDAQPHEKAKTVSAPQGFFEASPNRLKLVPTRKPEYDLNVRYEGAYKDPRDDKAKAHSNISGEAARASAPSKSSVISTADEDPIMVAAERAMKLERYESAMRLYESIEMRNPTYVRAIKGKADALKALGRFSEASKSYDRAAKLAPNDIEIEASQLSVSSEVNPGAALHDMLTMYRHQPENAKLAAQIGMTHARTGDFISAVQYLEKAHKIEKTNPIVAFNLAVAADRAGMAQRAVSYYQEALNIDNMYHGGKKLNRVQIYDRLSVLR